MTRELSFEMKAREVYLTRRIIIKSFLGEKVQELARITTEALFALFEHKNVEIFF